MQKRYASCFLHDAKWGARSLNPSMVLVRKKGISLINGQGIPGLVRLVLACVSNLTNVRCRKACWDLVQLLLAAVAAPPPTLSFPFPFLPSPHLSPPSSANFLPCPHPNPTTPLSLSPSPLTVPPTPSYTSLAYPLLDVCEDCGNEHAGTPLPIPCWPMDC